MPRSAVSNSTNATDADFVLLSISGPQSVECALAGHDRASVLTIGRRPAHGLVLDRPEVSRDHAEFRCIDSAAGRRWVLVDLGSRHHTRLNGQTLRSGEAYPVQSGDIIEISPWTFRLVTPQHLDSASTVFRPSTIGERQVRTLDDDYSGASGAMRTIVSGSRDLASERLQLLLSCAEAIVSAEDEQQLAEAVIDAATRGTGFTNAALLRPLMPDGTVSIIADTGAIHARSSKPSSSDATPRLSRSLIRQASLGQPVEISVGRIMVPTGHSIVDLKIQDAMCVPLMLEGAAAGFLYLDNRGEIPGVTRRSTRISEDAGAFAAGLSRIAALALMNLNRRDLEKRLGRMEGEIIAAASAQRLILPIGEVAIGPVRVHGECQPGRLVSGDFFDVLPLTDGRIAVALGDVAGKGVQASVLMTTTQGFLRGVLMRHGNLRQAVSDLNSYLYPRCDGGRFISLWIGAIDASLQTLEYVNAGHGHAWLQKDADTFASLSDAGGPLIGVVDLVEYRSATVPMTSGERIVLLSDGILEQPRGERRDDQFGFQRVRRVLSDTNAECADLMERLFDAVHNHAESDALADDATVVIGGW